MLDIMWIWGIAGLVLLGVEIVSGTMHAFWFGIGALLVAFLVWLIPAMPLPLQLLLFSAFSIGALIVWQRYYKKSSPNLRVGQSQGDEIGRVGTITEAVGAKQTGRISFTQGVMGSREWAAVSGEEIAVGAEAEIVAIEGNSLRVKPH
ncbi:MAG: NfeD family protein [Methylobacillus sp.]|jgi:membrane protein implicated in regulation of membrane protease activity|nr:NfeD family protein [Methylobacillus sp.]